MFTDEFRNSIANKTKCKQILTAYQTRKKLQASASRNTFILFVGYFAIMIVPKFIVGQENSRVLHSEATRQKVSPENYFLFNALKDVQRTIESLRQGNGRYFAKSLPNAYPFQPVFDDISLKLQLRNGLTAPLLKERVESKRMKKNEHKNLTNFNTPPILMIRADLREVSTSIEPPFENNTTRRLNQHSNRGNHVRNLRSVNVHNVQSEYHLYHRHRQHRKRRKGCPPLHGREQLLCPSRNTHHYDVCISREQLCDYKNDCPEGEDESPKHCLFYKPLDDQLKILNHAVLLLVDSVMVNQKSDKQNEL